MVCTIGSPSPSFNICLFVSGRWFHPICGWRCAVGALTLQLCEEAPPV